MALSLTSRIIQIGNSQGIRIPKAVLQQLGFVDEVTLEVQERQLVIRPIEQIRLGWDEQFQQMAVAGDDKLLDDVSVDNTWDDQEWDW